MKTKANKKNKEAANPSPETDLREQIEKRAYYLWLEAGGRHGDDYNHWLQAERELKSDLGSNGAFHD